MEIKINRKKPFDPKTFIGSNWSIESQNEASLKLKEIDLSQVLFEQCLEAGESWITGEEKLKRLQAKGGILLDAAVGQALYEEKGQKTLRALYNEKKIDWVEFPGTILCRSGGPRYFFCLDRRDDGSWDWCYDWLVYGRRAGGVSARLASSTETSGTKPLPSDFAPLTLEINGHIYKRV